MYRRGVASDASPFSRPLPLCGKTRGPSVLPAETRLHWSLPRGAAGVGRRNSVGRGIPDAPPGVGVFVLLGLP